jgi:mannose-6-phosphate isomerase-like protein (cupin superfamily)
LLSAHGPIVSSINKQTTGEIDMRAINMFVALAAIVLGSGMTCFATPPTAGAEYVSAEKLGSAVAAPTDSAIAKQMNSDTSTVIWSIKRQQSGEVELHRSWNDVIIAKEGTATVLVGDKVEGNRLFKPNEWLGGKIIGGHEYTLKPGDVLFIPAGLGHQMTLPAKQSFTYLVIKTAASG